MTEKLKNRETFVSYLAEKFPSIKDELLDEDYEGLLSLQIGVFRAYTQKSIDTFDNNTALKCFKFVDHVLSEVDNNVENSLVISFLGKLNFIKNPNLKEMLPKKLKVFIDALDNHSKSTPSNNKLDSFLRELDN